MSPFDVNRTSATIGHPKDHYSIRLRWPNIDRVSLQPSPQAPPPRILSWEFHARFFPSLLWSRLSPKENRPQGVSFNHNLGLTLLTAASMALVALGAPMASGPNHLVGWIIAAVGLAGTLYILLNSILGQRGLKPSYDDFHIWIFFFFVFLGLSGGLFLTSVNHQPRLMVLAAGVLGILPGYMAGILAGFWAQALGWISGLLDGLAGLAIFGLVIVNLLMLVA
jgi:hypothetical protein